MATTRSSDCGSSDCFYESTSRRDSCVSSSSGSSVDDSASDVSFASTTYCFCGQVAMQSGSIDDSEDDEIYCSAACARQDAMAALMGGEAVIASDRVSRSSRDSHAQHVSQYSHNRVTAACLALQESIMCPASHYRRMEQAHRESYPSDVFEDAFMTPSSGRTSLCASTRHVDVEQVRPPTTCIPTSKHIISLPASPSLDSDEEEEKLQRERQHAIEQEIRELDVMLKEQIDMFDAQNDDMTKWCTKADEEEEDVLTILRSPQLDYEAPLGWRRGTRVYSANFLGLQLHASPASSNSSTCAVDHSKQARVERLQAALDASLPPRNAASSDETSMDEKAYSAPKHASFAIPTALDMARELADLQTTWCKEAERPQLRESASPSPPPSQLMTDVLLLDGYPSAFATPPPHASSMMKRNLSNFFQRRPSQPASTFPHAGISSADLALTPNLIRSAPPRYVPLPSMLRR